MQSGYGGGGGGGGGVSDLQQFLVQDEGAVFSLSTNSTPPSAAAVAAATAPFSSHPFISYNHHHHPFLHLRHHHQPPQPPTPLPTHFSMPFLSVPVSVPPPPPPPTAAATQQLFYQEHDFRLFHLHPPSPPQPHAENHSGGSGDTGPSLLSAAAVNFKLAVDSSGGPEEESTMKELSWRPLDIDFIHNSSSNNDNNNKRQKSSCSDRHDEPEPLSKYGEKRSGNADNYKLFSELEAIYKPGSSSTTTTPAAAAAAVNQTGSGSALTGEDYPIIAATNAAAAGDEVPDDVGGTSETSAGEETPAGRNSNSQRAGITARKKRRWQRRQKRKQQQLETMVGFMEEMVKRLMDHQESLHRSFLEAVERRDRERSRSDESWREQAAARWSQEAAARAGDRALADAREAALISFLENISGDRIHLPEEEDDDDEEDKVNRHVTPAKTDATKEYSTSRWPRTEVEALIAVRSGLEPKFQEPGLKGPLWEEVSARMAALGFRRSAKRCKEKWENINKYFRKAKESGKARPLQSKTCPYFYHLDILYSKSADRHPPPTTTTDNSELLDAIVVSKDHHIGFKFDDEGDQEDDDEGEDPNCNKDRIVENNNK